MTGARLAPSTMLRMVPLPRRSATEEEPKGLSLKYLPRSDRRRPPVHEVG
jgi:hypothetical protein